MSDESFSAIPGKLIKRPAGLNPLSTRVFDVLAAHTAFPWPILETQARRARKDPLQLQKTDLEELIPRLIEALGRFAAPEKIATAERALRSLL